MKFHRFSPFPRSGFSLIEVAMAIGIFSFCLITIMGLIPVALKTTRSSFDKNIETRMLQATRANLTHTPYSTLPGAGSLVFDSEGTEILLPSSTEIRFRVSYTNISTTVLPGGQTAAKLTTALISISNTATTVTSSNSLHLPDNGF